MSKLNLRIYRTTQTENSDSIQFYLISEKTKNNSHLDHSHFLDFFAPFLHLLWKCGKNLSVFAGIDLTVCVINTV